MDRQRVLRRDVPLLRARGPSGREVSGQAAQRVSWIRQNIDLPRWLVFVMAAGMFELHVLALGIAAWALASWLWSRR